MTESQSNFCTTCGVKLGGKHTKCFTCKNKEEPQAQRKENEESFFGDTLWQKTQATFGLGFMLLIAVGVIGAVFGPSDDDKYYDGLDSYMRLAIEKGCEDEAKKNLNYPSTATFSLITRRLDVRLVNDKIYELIISNNYTAKNAFGVKQNFQYYCETKHTKGSNNVKITLFQNYEI